MQTVKRSTKMSTSKLYALALATLAAASSAQASFGPSPGLQIRQSTNESTCVIVPDQNSYVDSETLAQCGNATLFTTWRPKARFIAPEGWMNGKVYLTDPSDRQKLTWIRTPRRPHGNVLALRRTVSRR